MAGVAERLLTRRSRPSLLVSNPGMKFVIGLAAALCAVFSPRLIAALTTDQANVRFLSRDYFFLALAFSVLVAVAVMFLEWEQPRAPRDTFAMTLGLPAILAGALSTSESGRTVQQLVEAKKAMEKELSLRAGIQVEHANVTSEKGQSSPQGALVDLLEVPAYAQGEEAPSAPAMQSRYGVFVEESRYFVVIDRAQKQEDAQRRLADWTTRINLNHTNPQPPLNLQIERIRNEFLVVVTGGPRTKSSALLEALRVKDAYHITPTLVEVASRR